MAIRKKYLPHLQFPQGDSIYFFRKRNGKFLFILLTIQKENSLTFHVPLLSVPIRRAGESARGALGYAPTRQSN